VQQVVVGAEGCVFARQRATQVRSDAGTTKQIMYGGG